MFSTNNNENEVVFESLGIVPGQRVTTKQLRHVSELSEKYRRVFPFLEYFNVIQSSTFEVVVNSDVSVVVSAPTGSGKTVLFELAIVRLLEKRQRENSQYKIVYMAPIKALCSEKYSDWSSRFSHLGLRLLEVTGDSEDALLLNSIQNYDMIFTTPEKWDYLTRKWRDHAELVQVVKLFLIDEVHLLNEETRGHTLEAVVSRMKTVQDTLKWKNGGDGPEIRFIAVSATIPNIDDIAQWLKTPKTPAKFFKFGEEMRPVPLKKIVLGFPDSGGTLNGYRFDMSLTYKIKPLIMSHSQGKPTLVFCNTRKSVVNTSQVLLKQICFNFTPEQKKQLEMAAETLLDKSVKEMIKSGVGYHHAGLVPSDRHQIEQLFRSEFLPVLVSTSTLAMGVNLPAHTVIIKSTENYVASCWKEYTETQILQMTGRAGRPQFDTSATAIIMTRESRKAKYEKLISGQEIVESSLHKRLVEHLNAEIVLKTITDIAVAMNWIRSTFLYVRALRNPGHYGIQTGLSQAEIEAKLQGMCMRELNALKKYELVKTSDFAYNVESTENGRVMARYCIAFETMKIFMTIEGNETIAGLLEKICHSQEYHDFKLRRSEKSILNSLNRNKEKPTIRFQLEGKIKNGSMKANCLIQAVLGSIPIPDFGLVQESTRILRISERLLHGLVQFLWQKNDFEALVSALSLHKSVSAKMWENSPHVTRQLPGIGPALSALLVSSGKVTFKDILESNSRDLERIINRRPPMGNQLQEAASMIPNYDIEVDRPHLLRLVVTIYLLNAAQVQFGDTLHKFNVLVANEKNYILKKDKLCDQTVLTHRGGYEISINLTSGNAPNEIRIALISDSLVGVDIRGRVALNGTGRQVFTREEKHPVEPQLQPKSAPKKPIQKNLKDYAFLPAKKVLRKMETETDPSDSRQIKRDPIISSPGPTFKSKMVEPIFFPISVTSTEFVESPKTAPALVISSDSESFFESSEDDEVTKPQTPTKDQPVPEITEKHTDDFGSDDVDVDELLNDSLPQTDHLTPPLEYSVGCSYSTNLERVAPDPSPPVPTDTFTAHDPFKSLPTTRATPPEPDWDFEKSRAWVRKMDEKENEPSNARGSLALDESTLFYRRKSFQENSVLSRGPLKRSLRSEYGDPYESPFSEDKPQQPPPKYPYFTFDAPSHSRLPAVIPTTRRVRPQQSQSNSYCTSLSQLMSDPPSPRCHRPPSFRCDSPDRARDYFLEEWNKEPSPKCTVTESDFPFI